ncbi:MAG: clan AA aspartic protease [Cyanobium sp.]
MGYVHPTIELSNPGEPDLKPITTQALAESGALMLCIPEAMAVALKLEQQLEREVTGADGRTMRVPYVGPVKVTFQDRLCLVGALVLGDNVLLGAVPVEDMDLTIHPSRQQLDDHPPCPGAHRAPQPGRARSRPG